MKYIYRIHYYSFIIIVLVLFSGCSPKIRVEDNLDWGATIFNIKIGDISFSGNYSTLYNLGDSTYWMDIKPGTYDVSFDYNIFPSGGGTKFIKSDVTIHFWDFYYTYKITNDTIMNN